MREAGLKQPKLETLMHRYEDSPGACRKRWEKGALIECWRRHPRMEGIGMANDTLLSSDTEAEVTMGENLKDVSDTSADQSSP